VDVQRAAIAEGGYGFFAATGGALALRTGVITRQLDAAGVANGRATPPSMLVLEDVARYGNANDAELRDVDLPTASSLPLPTPVCADAVCQ
jgi:hypothetical protein